MKSIEVHNYKIDSANWVVESDGKPIGCSETAARVTEATKKSFGVFDWIYFYAVDFLSRFFETFKKRQFSVVNEHRKTILTSQNQLRRLQEKVDVYAKKHFQTIASNVEHIYDAEVICLGEVHGNLPHMYRNARVIDALSDPDDLLLVEHDENLTFRSDQAKFVRKPIPIVGWDKFDPSTVEELSSAFQLDPIDVIGVLFFDEIPMDREEKISWANQKILDELPERNEHMCKTIESNAKPGRRIFVIAGKGHFTPPKALQDHGLDLSPQQEAYEQTLAYLKTKKFAILIPKTEKLKLNWSAKAG